MSFGPSKAEKQAQASQQQVSAQSQANSKQLMGMGTNEMGAGIAAAQPGVNFFNTLLNGNRQESTALMQPDIDRIREQNAQSLKAISTLMPRGGGREGALFSASYAPNAAINSLFNGLRSGSANSLMNYGLQREGIGANLFNPATSSLNTSTNANQSVMDYGLKNRQLTNSLWTGLGSGLFGLATTPFGGGAAANGLLGLLH